MKHIHIPLKKADLEIVLSFQIRRKFRWKKLSFCGRRKKTRFHIELEGRMIQDFHVTWRWFPFIEFFHVKDGKKSFGYYGDDPFPLQCFVEYEFWKHKHGSFDREAFILHLMDKFNLTRGAVLEGCTDVMLPLYEKGKGRIE